VRARRPDAENVDKLMPAKVARDAAATVAGVRQEAHRARPRAISRRRRSTPSDGTIASTLPPTARPTTSTSRTREGRAAATRLAEALASALASCPSQSDALPRDGGYYNDVEFVRPAHSLLALHGADVVPSTRSAWSAGRAPAAIASSAAATSRSRPAEAYAPTLEAEGKVHARFRAPPRRDRRAARAHAARRAR
jgi:glycyl-tRNA synthetase beta chain